MGLGILNIFRTRAPAPLPVPDARLALGALMVRVAKSDKTYDFEEIRLIDRLLAQMHGLNPVEAAKLRATCEKIEAQAPDTGEFARLIRDSVEFDQRVQAHEALWQVMLADGVANEAESRVVDQVRDALGLSMADCEAARARANMN